jgi:hypothetical protein
MPLNATDDYQQVCVIISVSQIEPRQALDALVELNNRLYDCKKCGGHSYRSPDKRAPRLNVPYRQSRYTASGCAYRYGDLQNIIPSLGSMKTLAIVFLVQSAPAQQNVNFGKLRIRVRHVTSQHTEAGRMGKDAFPLLAYLARHLLYLVSANRGPSTFGPKHAPVLTYRDWIPGKCGYSDERANTALLLPGWETAGT